jgi:HNH endonuclease
MGRPRMDIEDRFWSKVLPLADCWNWRGAKTEKGYGHLSMFDNGKKFNIGAHRLSYELFFGPIPAEMTIDHLCENPSCVRPDHLALATMKENVLRGHGITALNARKIHCHRGHPLTGENVYVTFSGGRACKICKRDWMRTKRKAMRIANGN